MPITGPSSYVSTTEEFIAHWNLVNSHLGVLNPLVLADGTTVNSLQLLRDTLNIVRAELQDKINLREGARAELNAKKEEMRAWLHRFNDVVRADFDGTKWVKMLPRIPAQTEGRGAYSIAFDDAKSIWAQMNADPGIPQDIVLMGGYDLVAFTADVADLSAYFTAVINTEMDESGRRADRNALQTNIYEVLKMYRRKVPTLFPADHELVQLMPRLTPEPGSTPDPVALEGFWQPNPGYAVLTWTESGDPLLLRYELRMTQGPNYDTETDSIVQSFQPGTLNTQTVAGLGAPGSTASFKLYVILSNGHEAGSNTITISNA